MDVVLFGEQKHLELRELGRVEVAVEPELLKVLEKRQQRVLVVLTLDEEHEEVTEPLESKLALDCLDFVLDHLPRRLVTRLAVRDGLEHAVLALANGAGAVKVEAVERMLQHRMRLVGPAGVAVLIVCQRRELALPHALAEVAAGAEGDDPVGTGIQTEPKAHLETRIGAKTPQ